MGMEPADRAEWVTALGELRFFREFNRRELEQLLGAVEIKKYGLHEYIVRDGDKGSCLYVILKGQVSVLKRDLYYSNRRLAFLRAGDCFGEMGLLMGGYRQADILAVVKTYVMPIAENVIESVEEGIRLKFYRQLAFALSRKLGLSNAQTLSSAL